MEIYSSSIDEEIYESSSDLEINTSSSFVENDAVPTSSKQIRGQRSIIIVLNLFVF